MARSSLTALIALCRTRIFDTNIPYVFQDDDIEDVLDTWRSEHRWTTLRPVPNFTTGGTTLFLDFYSESKYWEDDYLLQDMSFVNITANPDVKEPIVGHWHFVTQPNGIGVRITGKTYDIYGAMADLLESWATRVMLEFDVEVGSGKYARTGKFNQLTKMAERFRAQAMARTSRMNQSDENPDFGGGPGVTFPSYGSGYDGV